ncbi:MAG: hypothetical protein AUJ76_00480 [Candidatus Omnitrophica bacterium CG1_02_41_171]|nr:MAG: hypothetical protein AUJ76_00480 [Candidatus Omnitrophica bacterium CG1_02_41_171]
MVLRIFFSFAFGYLLGSVCSAYLIAKLVKGVDIRRVGTGNPGAANVYREVGKPWGILVWVFDTAKGALAMFVAAKLTNNFPKPVGIWILFLALVGVVAIAGHCWSIFLSFKGGKGVATSGGAVLYLAPKLFPLVLLLYFFVQRKGPRSAPLLLLAIVVFFVFLIFLYPHCYLWLVPAVLFLIGIGVLANVSALKEMRR